ncbi:hypothetical protein BRADI_2g52298v3, partial [Brachypodium distachyon]
SFPCVSLPYPSHPRQQPPHVAVVACPSPTPLPQRRLLPPSSSLLTAALQIGGAAPSSPRYSPSAAEALRLPRQSRCSSAAKALPPPPPTPSWTPPSPTCLPQPTQFPSRPPQSPLAPATPPLLLPGYHLVWQPHELRPPG